MRRDKKRQNRLELTQLGSVLALVCLILHLMWGRDDSLLIGLAVLFLVVAAVMPRLLSPVNRVWQAVGRIMGRIMNPLMYGLLYYIFLTPLAWLQKAFGGKTLDLDIDRDNDSYWEETKSTKMKPSDLTRPF